MKHSLELTTSRLVLIGATPALLSADKAGPTALATVIAAVVPTSWPPEHHDGEVIDWVLGQLDTMPASSPWRLFYIALRNPRTLIGTCGFKGPPDHTKGVEVGYSVLEAFRGRGYATEAVQALIETAFDGGATEVAAETFPALPASLRVMEKCRMTLAGSGAEAGTVRYRVQRN